MGNSLFFWLGGVALLAVALWLWLSRSNGKQPSQPKVTRDSTPQASLPSSGMAASRQAPATQPEPWRATTVPPPLAAFSLTHSDSLSNASRDLLLARLKSIPRPPRSFQQLVSPDFLLRATSTELADLVLGEPLIAGKVLARVNSPVYGLQKPVVQIGQAVTYLGLNAVRGICVQYMLDESFKSDSPEIQKIFDDIWKAGAVASDLCFRLGQKLRLPDPGVLSTHVVLSYVGHLAAAALLPKEVAVATAHAGLLERAQAEQSHLGVAACELARLLMHSWELPAELIERVSIIDSVLVTPSHVTDSPMQAEQTGLSYLSARVGESLAQGQLSLPSDITDLEALGTDGFYLGSYMQLPHLQHCLQALQAPELNVAIERMLQALNNQDAQAQA